MAKSVDIDAKPLRTRPAIAAVIAEMQKKTRILDGDLDLLSELRTYTSVKPLLPTIIDADAVETVRTAQRALNEIQGRFDRVATIFLDARRVSRTLSRLDILVRKELSKAGMISEKTSKPSAELLVSLVVPELAICQKKWAILEKSCDGVQRHLSDAKQTLQMQIKLDENLRWAQRAAS